MNDTTRIGVFNKKGWIKDIFTGLSLKKALFQNPLEIRFDPGLTAGKYYLIFGINNGTYNITHNSSKIELLIK
jgi:hypothetical protein